MTNTGLSLQELQTQVSSLIEDKKAKKQEDLLIILKVQAKQKLKKEIALKEIEHGELRKKGAAITDNLKKEFEKVKAKMDVLFEKTFGVSFQPFSYVFQLNKTANPSSPYYERETLRSDSTLKCFYKVDNSGVYIEIPVPETLLEKTKEVYEKLKDATKEIETNEKETYELKSSLSNVDEKVEEYSAYLLFEGLDTEEKETMQKLMQKVDKDSLLLE